MKELLTAEGWKLYYSCFCNGIYQERFNHPDKPGWKINIRPKKNRFKARKNNATVKEDFGYKLEDYLKTI